jgi:pimeloyl-ACP methyl ester carboxylesterase
MSQIPTSPPSEPPADLEGFSHRSLRANGIRFHVVEHGPEAGEPVLLLHGFPEFWYSWRHQLRALGDAGYRAIAPDLRGYNLSDKPAGVKSYAPEVLAADVAALVRALGYDKVNLAGHDWGGAVAWITACLPPHREVIKRLAILNAPHPGQFLKNLSAAQLRKSWYMLFFQLPLIPEWVLRKDGFRNLRRTLRGGAAQRGVFSEEDLRLYAEAFSQPGASTAAINYYRAALRRNPIGFMRMLEPIPAEIPSLLIWGEQDPALGRELTLGLGEVAPQLRVEYIQDSGHWVQQEQPDQANRCLLDFFQGRRVGTPAA